MCPRKPPQSDNSKSETLFPPAGCPAQEFLATALFGLASATLFLCSFLYHRVKWSPAAEVSFAVTCSCLDI
jgi:predicted membrane channel-forming protein YqfA (hemolysin III family)